MTVETIKYKVEIKIQKKKIARPLKNTCTKYPEVTYKFYIGTVEGAALLLAHPSFRKPLTPL